MPLTIAHSSLHHLQSGTLMLCQMFYIIMFCSTARTSKLNEARDKWHSGWWSVKSALWVGTTIIPFLLPSAVIQLYGSYIVSFSKISINICPLCSTEGCNYTLCHFILSWHFPFSAGEIAHFGAGYCLYLVCVFINLFLII